MTYTTDHISSVLSAANAAERQAIFNVIDDIAEEALLIMG